MILQILGIIFLIALCVVAYFAWKFHRVYNAYQVSELSNVISVLPPLYFELERSQREEWKEQEQLGHVESQLKRLGAHHAGYFCTYNDAVTIRTSLWDFEKQVVVAIYEGVPVDNQAEVLFAFEVVSKLNDGTICITSNANSELSSRPENHPLIFNDSNSILEFIKALKEKTPKGASVEKIKDPKEFFLDCNDEMTVWGWSSAQLNSDKTQQLFSAIGVKPTTELMGSLVEMGEDFSVEVNTKRARKLVSKHSDMTAEQWERIRDKLVFVNEEMRVDHLENAIYELTESLSINQEQALDGFIENTTTLTDPIGAFQMLIQSLNLNVKRVTSMESPIKTEVYMSL